MPKSHFLFGPPTIGIKPVQDVLATFSPWTPWIERKNLHLGVAGVYLLARFETAAPSGTPEICSNIIYIGETCGQTLAARLRQFDRSGSLGRTGHSGGMTFAATFGLRTDVPWLYIAAMGTSLSEPQSSAFIRYVERTLLWEYVQLFDSFPTCNRK